MIKKNSKNAKVSTNTTIYVAFAKNTIHENYFHPGPSTSKFQGTQKSNHPTCPPGEEWCAPPTQAYGCWPTHICP